MSSVDEGRRNRLLAALPEDAYGQCMDQLEPVELPLRKLLFERDRAITEVYFPIDAVCSLLTFMADGTVVECATVGNEGLVGLQVFLGAADVPMTAMAQVRGGALRIDAEAFRRLLADTDGTLQVVIQRYTQTLFTQLAQSVACNRLHTIDQRCARWLLMTADRVGTPQFPLTHEFMAQMLGVRRAGVSETARRLADTGCISYRRGVVTILDRQRLQQASCECYGVVSAMLARQLGDAGDTGESEDDGTVPSPL